MIWRDGQGREWDVEATPDAVVLRSEQETHQVRRADWERDICVQNVSQGVVIRFYGADWELGFLVSPSRAAPLLEHLNRRAAETAPEPPESPRRRAPDGPTWPKMMPSPVWSVILGSLAFLPVLGWAFGAAALVLAIRFLCRARRTPALSHARVMAGVGIAWTLAGLAVSVLCVYCAHRLSVTGYSATLVRGNGEYSHAAIAVSLIVVLLSLSVPECGHAITAWWCGDDYARSLGRVTLNPLAHIDPFGTVVLPILLLVTGAPVFGFAKPVPVLLGSVQRYRRAHILISLAGPGSNLLLAAVAALGYLLIGCLLMLGAPDAEVFNLSTWIPQVFIENAPGAQVLEAVAMVLKSIFTVNLFLAVFNLVPIPPLDGSWILEHLFPEGIGRLMAAIRPFGFILFLAAFYADVFQVVFVPAQDLLSNFYWLVYRCTGL
ncbi:MAG: site-2 protease family protein [Phycisphaerae bacterium]|nr:site-2 protease family protein [Phycisphaerae bacterium]